MNDQAELVGALIYPRAASLWAVLWGFLWILPTDLWIFGKFCLQIGGHFLATWVPFCGHFCGNSVGILGFSVDFAHRSVDFWGIWPKICGPFSGHVGAILWAFLWEFCGNFCGFCPQICGFSGDLAYRLWAVFWPLWCHSGGISVGILGFSRDFAHRFGDFAHRFRDFQGILPTVWVAIFWPSSSIFGRISPGFWGYFTTFGANNATRTTPVCAGKIF